MNVLLSTNVLVVGKNGKVLLTFPLYFLQMGNQIFCSEALKGLKRPCAAARP